MNLQQPAAARYSVARRRVLPSTTRCSCMRIVVKMACSAAAIFLCIPGLALSHVRRGPPSHKLLNKRAAHASAKPTSQRSIDTGRATQIQTALIRSGFLTGEANGQWDSATGAAMQKYQAANGWQTKIIPDSRAIIKLGLGPSATVSLSSPQSSMLADTSPQASK